MALLTAIPAWNAYPLTKVSLNDESAYTPFLALQRYFGNGLVGAVKG
ncbi:hypothetical protein [Streptomyces yatensis]|uniref:Tn3 transposase DDE domain-containing protein n=1 Tax=Streptomyces yatensis TaxID=155177 RepID=A0ABP4U911_9ACTN|nr:hypothetical protein [Streptomyces yatensis]